MILYNINRSSTPYMLMRCKALFFLCVVLFLTCVFGSTVASPQSCSRRPPDTPISPAAANSACLQHSVREMPVAPHVCTYVRRRETHLFDAETRSAQSVQVILTCFPHSRAVQCSEVLQQLEPASERHPAGRHLLSERHSWRPAVAQPSLTR